MAHYEGYLTAHIELANTRGASLWSLFIAWKLGGTYWGAIQKNRRESSYCTEL